MLRFISCCFSLLLLAACDPAGLGPVATEEGAGPVCSGQGSARCQFVNGPVKLTQDPVKLATRRALFYPMADALDFVDGKADVWQAPQGTLTDGASIPPLFVGIVGNPTSDQFAQAAAIHDAYCGIGNEGGARYHSRPWPQVHRMFYDALRVGGTPERKAKLMFAAVWLGGPRWGVWDRGLLDVPGSEKQDILRQAQGLIDTQNPSVDELVGFLSRAEALAIAKSRNTVHGGGADGHGYYGGDPSDY